jgi:hypothetical protein
MVTVLLSEIPRGSFFSVTTSSAAPILRPPWVLNGYGWIASNSDDQVIYLNPGRPLIASSAARLIEKLTQKGLFFHTDDE